MRRRLNDKEWVHEFVSAIMGASASGPTHEDELDAVRSLLSAFLGELPDHSHQSRVTLAVLRRTISTLDEEFELPDPILDAD